MNRKATQFWRHCNSLCIQNRCYATYGSGIVPIVILVFRVNVIKNFRTFYIRSLIYLLLVLWIKIVLLALVKVLWNDSVTCWSYFQRQSVVTNIMSRHDQPDTYSDTLKSSWEYDCAGITPHDGYCRTLTQMSVTFYFVLNIKYHLIHWKN